MIEKQKKGRKSIGEYKEKLVSVVKEMEEEYGCDISRVTIDIVEQYNGFYSRTYNVHIDNES